MNAHKISFFSSRFSRTLFMRQNATNNFFFPTYITLSLLRRNENDGTYDDNDGNVYAIWARRARRLFFFRTKYVVLCYSVSEFIHVILSCIFVIFVSMSFDWKRYSA